MREEDTTGTGAAAEGEEKAPAEAGRREGLDMGESDEEEIGGGECGKQY